MLLAMDTAYDKLVRSMGVPAGQKVRDDGAVGQNWEEPVQFHLNGFEPGDPEIFDHAERYPESDPQRSLPDEVDVLIVGCGPAGLTLAAQLSAFPDIKTCIVEQKSGRLVRGQAAGIACRTGEMVEGYG